MKRQTKRFFALAAALVVLTSFYAPAFAAEPKVVYTDKESGITVYRDAAGGIVVSGMMVPLVASEEDRMAQLTTLKALEAREAGQKTSVTRAPNYVDYEYNPIYIGNWGYDCYARHTLGSHIINPA